MKESNTLANNQQCVYQATTKGSLIKHQRIVHEGVKYFCRQCGKQFTQKSKLSQHQKTMHEGIYRTIKE